MTSLTEVGTGVISERDEPYAVGYKDCGQASFMRALADAGVLFPRADDLVAEREALERSDSYADEMGAPMWALIQAANRRYGYSGQMVTNMATAVRTPGHTLVMQGPFTRFPTYQQRWQPGSSFGHAVAYRVDSATWGTLLDPLAPWGFRGDRVPPEVMERFCWGAPYIRSMEWNDAVMNVATIEITVKLANPRPWRVAAGVTLRGYDPARPGVTVVSHTFAGAGTGTFDRVGFITQSPNAIPNGGPFLRAASGKFDGLWIVARFVTADIGPDPDPNVAELAALRARIAIADKKIAAARSALL